MIATLEAMLIICKRRDRSVCMSVTAQWARVFDGPNQQAPHNVWAWTPNRRQAFVQTLAAISMDFPQAYLPTHCHVAFS